MSSGQYHIASPHQVVSIDEASADHLRSRVVELEAQVGRLEGRLATYARVFYENPVPAVVYQAQTLQILETNESAQALYGYKRDQIRSLNLMDLFGPNARHDCPGLESELRRYVNAIGPCIHTSATGEDLVVTLVFFTFDMQGVDARILMIQNETARHTAEEALRASEERFRELFENANDAIFLYNLKGEITAVNRAAETLTGYTRLEILGQHFSDLVAPEARHNTDDSIRAHLGGSTSQHFELPIISKSGTRRFLEISTRIIYRRGQPLAVQGIGRDVTERKLAEQRLLESARELQLKNEELSTALSLAREATQLKEQFLANTSHELRTPMNGIMGMVDLLRSTKLTDDQAEYAGDISTCATDLLTIIDDILDLSQIEAGHVALTDTVFEIGDSLKAVVKLLRLRATAKDLSLSYEIDPALPSSVYGDSVRFKQIVTNLIANAIKFTPEGGVHVSLGLTPDRASISCAVVDTGIGVPEAVRQRIFEAFVQADGTTRRRFGGTGLGLTICKQLVEIMGGHIGVRSNEPAGGSTFWFDLPLRPAGQSLAEAAFAARTV